MSETIIRVENLSKKYIIQHNTTKRADTFRDAVMAGGRSLGKRLRHPLQAKGDGTHEEFWALKDINFEVKRGDVVGIIGRNGAGKSTLLKILSRITEPTAGRATIDGRIASLLEVGTGFHGELSGRENIYLNGAILGMARAEIARKFDEIVSFAEVEASLDLPVKHFSSGMYMRLAFAVAVHLEPEILIVDEVLAVGDAQFQKKCLLKMNQVGEQGRTILFVSHNMAAMRSICANGIVMEKGSLVRYGEINEVADFYLARSAEQSESSQAVETQGFIVHDVSVKSPDGPVIKTFSPVEIRIRATAKVRIVDPGFYVGFLTTDYFRLAGFDYKDFGKMDSLQASQQFEVAFRVDSLPLLPGTYQLEIHVKDLATRLLEIVPLTYFFDVVETPVYGGRKLDHWFGTIGLKVKVGS